MFRQFMPGPDGKAVEVPRVVTLPPPPPPPQQQPLVAPRGTLPVSYVQLNQFVEYMLRKDGELAQKEQEFMREMNRMNFYSSFIYENAEKIGQLQRTLDNVDSALVHIETVVDASKTDQAEFEAEVSRLEAEVAHFPLEVTDTDTPEWRQLVALQAQKLSLEFQTVSEDLNAVITDINNRSTAGHHDPISQITQVLSDHLDTLQWLEHGALDEISKNVAKVEDSRKMFVENYETRLQQLMQKL